MRTKRYMAIGAMALGLVAIVLGLSMRLNANDAQAATTATFTANDPAASHPLSTPFNVTVDLSGVTFDGGSPNWGGYDLELSFQSSFLSATGIATPGSAASPPNPSGVGELCQNAASAWSGDLTTPGSVVTGCAFQTNTTTSGVLETITFNCTADGTTALHLVVPRDPASIASGSSLFNGGGVPFGMTLVDDTVVCGTGGGTPTNTPIPTNTFTPTVTRTPTNTPLPTNTFTPTATFTPCPGNPPACPTNTPTNTPTATNTPQSGIFSTATPTGTRSPEAGTETATSVPGQPTNTRVPGGTGNLPGGGAGGAGGAPRITLPDTGGHASGNGAMGGIWLIVSGVVLATLGGGMLVTAKRRA